MKTIFLIGFLLLVTNLKGQGIIESFDLDDSTSAYLIDPISDDFSINELPKNINPIKNKLSLYVDYTDIDSVHGFVIGYIINNTNSSHYFRMSSMHSLILPEFEICENIWQRYVPFNYGWCGTPYAGNDEIDKLTFHKVLLRYSFNGEKKLIRYKMYDHPPLISNEGFGFVDSAGIKLSSFDDIAFENFDLLELSEIAYGNQPIDLPMDRIRHLRFKAIKFLFFSYGSERTGDILFNLIIEDNEFSKYAKKLFTKDTSSN